MTSLNGGGVGARAASGPLRSSRNAVVHDVGERADRIRCPRRDRWRRPRPADSGLRAAHEIAREVRRGFRRRTETLPSASSYARATSASWSPRRSRNSRNSPAPRRSSVRTRPGSADRDCRSADASGLKLIAKPNSRSCISGTPTIIAEGEPVAPHLDEFLDQDGADAREARSGRSCESRACSCSWMKTSSRLAAPRGSCRPFLVAIGRKRRSSARAIAAADMQGGAEERRRTRRPACPRSFSPAAHASRLRRRR